MQQELIAGDSLNFVSSTPGYPASAGWMLKFRLIPRAAGGTPIDLTAVAEGDDHRVAVAAATTAQWVAGAYSWTSWVEAAGETYTLEGGQIVVQPDPRQAAAGYDNRSLAVRTLEDLMAAKAGWDTTSGRQRRYRIGEREMEFASEAEILQKIKFWQFEVQRETNAARLAKGLSAGNRFYVRAR